METDGENKSKYEQQQHHKENINISSSEVMLGVCEE